MSEKVKILLTGIGGYAATYVNPLLDGVRPDCEIVGCADPFPNSCKRLDEIRERGIPLFSDMEGCCAASGTVFTVWAAGEAALGAAGVRRWAGAACCLSTI